MNFQLNKHGKNYVNSSKITTHFSRQMNMIRKRVLRNFQHFDLTNFLEPKKSQKISLPRLLISHYCLWTKVRQIILLPTCLMSRFRITAWLFTSFFFLSAKSARHKNHTGTRGMLFCLRQKLKIKLVKTQ